MSIENTYSDLVLEELKNPTKMSSIVSTLDINNRELTEEEEKQFFERVYHNEDI